MGGMTLFHAIIVCLSEEEKYPRYKIGGEWAI